MDPRRLETLVEERIASGQVELPVFPSSAQEVLSLCDAEDVDHKKLAATIRRDATLAGHFLSLANSAAAPVASRWAGCRGTTRASIIRAIRRSSPRSRIGACACG